MSRIRRYGFPVFALLVLPACGGGGGGGSIAPPPVQQPPPPTTTALFREVTATDLPVVDNACMDAAQGDLDGDGDIDLALASEFALNVILLNNGAGVFTELAGAVSDGRGDNEDLRLADFDDDGDLDMITVHEDDQEHALLFNDGSGAFTDMTALLPVMSIANAVEVTDLDGDGAPDILIGNAGANVVLIQQPDGSFADDTANGRSLGSDTTQDLLLVDVDGDSDLDVFVANEGPNALFINDGNGFFADETAVRLPSARRESRQADAADIDNDGDLDIIVGNIRFEVMSVPSVENQLLVNDGSGVFTDATATGLANVRNLGNSFTVHFVDLDDDGDQDIISPQTTLGGGGDAVVWLNDGTGVFTDATTADVFSSPPDGGIFDIEVVDVNGDGNDDLFVCNRTGISQLYVK